MAAVDLEKLLGELSERFFEILKQHGAVILSPIIASQEAKLLRTLRGVIQRGKSLTDEEVRYARAVLEDRAVMWDRISEGKPMRPTGSQ